MDQETDQYQLAVKPVKWQGHQERGYVIIAYLIFKAVFNEK